MARPPSRPAPPVQASADDRRDYDALPRPVWASTLRRCERLRRALAPFRLPAPSHPLAEGCGTKST